MIEGLSIERQEIATEIERRIIAAEAVGMPALRATIVRDPEHALPELFGVEAE